MAYDRAITMTYVEEVNSKHALLSFTSGRRYFGAESGQSRVYRNDCESGKLGRSILNRP